MSIPDFTIIKKNGKGRIVERRCTFSHYVDYTPFSLPNYLTEFVFSSDDVNEAGFYCDVFYQTPQTAVEDDMPGWEKDVDEGALVHLQIVKQARIAFFTAEEAKDILYVLEESNGQERYRFVNVEGRLVDCGAGRLLASYYDPKGAMSAVKSSLLNVVHDHRRAKASISDLVSDVDVADVLHMPLASIYDLARRIAPFLEKDDDAEDLQQKLELQERVDDVPEKHREPDLFQEDLSRSLLRQDLETE